MVRNKRNEENGERPETRKNEELVGGRTSLFVGKSIM